MNVRDQNLLERRAHALGPNVRLFYDEPVHLVRGAGTWVYDDRGRKFLDCYNNVPHVGHCHPHVVEAICKQAGTLNTHTRYLHAGILDYVERLTAKHHPGITTAIMVCTGSEANDLALRMAEASSGHRGFIATNHTYHGNTVAVSQLSVTSPPPGGFAGHIRHVPAPDSYRPTHADFAAGFAAHVEDACKSLVQSGHGVAGMILCPFFVNEGFPELPKGSLDEAARIVRAHGGVIIGDEVQPGFGRIGSHMWGYERIGLVPEIVTMGKSMGNGHPVAAVATSLALMSTFRNAFKYFNTFGGNPVSCAAANAVLDVLETEELQSKALATGSHLMTGLRKLAERYHVIGDVRGSGLAIGVEVVSDRTQRTPDKKTTDAIVNDLRQNGVLAGSNGINYNVLKIRPPLQFGLAEADHLLDVLGHVLART
jgi:4-aminobutyrate aminotransferase-like enzyme